MSRYDKYKSKNDWELTHNELWDKYEPMAQHFASKFYTSQLAKRLGTHEDILQECYTCLWRAILKYDPDRRLRFSTFAYRMVPRWLCEEACFQGLIKIPRIGSKRKDKNLLKMSTKAITVAQLDEEHWQEPEVEQKEPISEDIAELKNSYKKIDPKLMKIVKERYRLGQKGTPEMKTCKEIGSKRGVSRQDIGIKEHRGVKQLRDVLLKTQLFADQAGFWEP